MQWFIVDEETLIMLVSSDGSEWLIPDYLAREICCVVGASSCCYVNTNSWKMVGVIVGQEYYFYTSLWFISRHRRQKGMPHYDFCM